MAPTQSLRSSPIPRFYRALFAYIDPALAFFVTYQTFFKPVDFVAPYLASPTTKLDSLHHLLLHQLGAGYLGSGLKSLLVLLGFKFWAGGHEVSLGVWKALVAGFLVEDCGLIFSVLAGMRAQGRLRLGGVRSGEWGIIGLVGTAMALRSAFLMDVGLGKTRKGSKSS